MKCVRDDIALGIDLLTQEACSPRSSSSARYSSSARASGLKFSFGTGKSLIGKTTPIAPEAARAKTKRLVDRIFEIKVENRCLSRVR